MSYGALPVREKSPSGAAPSRGRPASALALSACVLLGVATSASMMHGIIPAAVAARLRVESFRLWSPRAIMTAVQERVLLDPGFVPAPSNASLETLVTRFAEHDFSLSAARRAMHLLALDHFMTRELSSMAMCMTAASSAAAAGR